MDESLEIRKYVCSCLCEFFMPNGIEPNFCPFCGGACAAFKDLPQSPNDIGRYEEPAA